jgi:2-succinyl-5-enolpyruvyl-6-hydroxy-3-cyclohexene-1-carboxylate synthase
MIYNNSSTLWANIFVEEITKMGISHACISPGSRSTPITHAIAISSIKSHIIVDERSSAFFAIGLAKQLKQPVLLVCTSGTASANYYPAIMEAHNSNIPLIVVTADRPHELRNSGANQTTDQIKLYGSLVKMFVDVALVEQNPSNKMIRYIKLIASKAYCSAMTSAMGPVHLNFPFRKPLDPNSQDHRIEYNEVSSNSPLLTCIPGTLETISENIKNLVEIISSNPKGLIICGPEPLGNSYIKEIVEFSNKMNYPILADPSSGLRFTSHKAKIITTYDHFLLKKDLYNKLRPDIIFLFGREVTSKHLLQFLDHEYSKHVIRIQINDINKIIDSSLKLTHYYSSNPQSMLKKINNKIREIEDTEISWMELWIKLENQVIEVISAASLPINFEGTIIREFLSLIPEGSDLFIGNSSSIRYVDQFSFDILNSLNIHSNRGLSGIDGNIAIALGIASAKGDPIYAILGDLSLFHDSNSLQIAKNNNIPITIFLINNQGGGIFHRLPISTIEDKALFEDYFITPQNIDFEHLAKAHGFTYELISEVQSMNSVDMIPSLKIIEIKTDAVESNKISNQLMEKIRLNVDI